MKLFVDFAEVRVSDVSVNLGGANVGVAKHSLDAAEVGAVHQEVGGEGVAEGVRGDVFGDAGGSCVVVDDALDGAGGEATEVAAGVDGVEVVRVVKKEGRKAVVADCEVVASGVGCGFADEDRAVFFAFAANDKLATVEVDGIAVEIDELGDAETAGEKKFDDGAVAEAGLGVGGDGV